METEKNMLAIIDKVANDIPNFKHIEQITTCREYLELAKPFIPIGTYIDLSKALLNRLFEMETEFNEFRFRMQPSQRVTVFEPVESCGSVTALEDTELTSENIAKVASPLILK